MEGLINVQKILHMVYGWPLRSTYLYVNHFGRSKTVENGVIGNSAPNQFMNGEGVIHKPRGQLRGEVGLAKRPFYNISLIK